MKIEDRLLIDKINARIALLSLADPRKDRDLYLRCCAGIEALEAVKDDIESIRCRSRGGRKRG